jgi:hypothetical protein
MEAEAVRLLAKHYDSEKTLRDVLRIAQRSLQHALSDGIESVTTQLIEQAIAQLNDRG